MHSSGKSTCFRLTIVNRALDSFHAWRFDLFLGLFSWVLRPSSVSCSIVPRVAIAVLDHPFHALGFVQLLGHPGVDIGLACDAIRQKTVGAQDRGTTLRSPFCLR